MPYVGLTRDIEYWCRTCIHYEENKDILPCSACLKCSLRPIFYVSQKQCDIYKKQKMDRKDIVD